MIRGKLIHPEILGALAGAGHGSTVLISDGNFPHDTAPNAAALRVYLNLSPGHVTVSEVLAAVLSVIAIEEAAFMTPQDPTDWVPPAHADLDGILPAGTTVKRLPRAAFYEATRDESLALVVATGDTRPYANVLLTIGVIFPED